MYLFHHNNLSLNDRQRICSKCGSHHDRDINAAINIFRGCLEPLVEQMSDASSRKR
ncbi:MAG: zinc ribbon domain-containing protein [Candidatus Poribacteria bacterium]|nr:zinc ribbon domain-containing protein [Candidatus Poribacteria bacterium]